MPAPESAWTPDRWLTNAKFESYKLSFDDDADEDRQRIPLASSSALPGRTLRAVPDGRLGYKEARNRAKWNHLAAGKPGQAGWIDSEGSFWLIDVSESSPAIPQLVATLPQPVEAFSGSSSSHATTTEYPVARHLDNDAWACSDGTGRLYVVDASTKSIRADYELCHPTSGELLPFLLHSVTSHGELYIATVSTSFPGSSSAAGGRVNKKPSFQVILVSFMKGQTSEVAARLRQLTRLQGSDTPSYVNFVGDRCCIGATCTYKSADTVEDNKPAESLPAMSTSAEIVGIPRADQVSSPPMVSATSPPPPYSWTQETDSVTVVFPLPSSTKAKDIKVVFTPNNVSVSVTAPASGDLKIPIPHLVQARMWDVIDAGTSTWTWEKTGGEKGKFGILALHLEKRNEGTRWVNVFKAKAEGNQNIEASYLEVEETLDRSELLKITEALEKYTSELGSDPQGGLAGLDQRSSLLGEEFDMDVDADERQSGKSIVFTWVDDITGDSPRVSDTTRAESTDLVSSPIPVSSALSSAQSVGIVVKHDVDGMYFTPPVSSPSTSWQHASTYPALAFVLASKRDVVQIYHYKERLCIGLEAGSPAGSSASNARTSYSSMQTARMNAYLYYPPPPGSKAKTAKQRVVGLAEPSAGAVLGATAIEGEGTRVDMVILCEKSIVLLKNVL